MFNDMFLFSKTATRIETAGVVALILGLAAFLAPALMTFLATVAAVVALWRSFSDRTALKVILSVVIIVVSVLFLGSLMPIVAIALAGFGVVGVAMMIIRFARTQIREASEDSEKAEETDDEELDSFFDSPA